MDEVEMSALCRFCLSREKGLQPIFTSNTTILRKIADVIQIEVAREDGLPNYICQHCVFQLNSAHRFKQRCSRSVAKLRTFMLQKTEAGLLSPLLPSEESDSDADFDPPLCEVVYTDPIDGETKHSAREPQLSLQPMGSDHNTTHAVISDRDHNSTHIGLPENDPNSAHIAGFDQITSLPCSDIKVKVDLTDINTSVKEELLSDYPENEDPCAMKHEVEDKTDIECVIEGQSEPCEVLNTELVEEKDSKLSLVIQTVGKLRATQKKKESKNVPVICEICGKLFKKNHLYYHRKLHTAERQHECSTCHKTFKMVSHLKRHARLHDGDKSFLCSYCGKSFIDSSNLRNHVRNHKQERNYKCVTCNKSFARAETLTKHLRSHTGEKPYTCEVCARLFPRKDSLIRHMKSHRGERPHKCDSCDRCFTQSYDLKLHRRKHAARQI